MPETKKIISVYDFLFICLLVMMVGYFVVAPLRNTSVRHVFVFGGSLIVWCISIYQIVTGKFNKKSVLSLFVIISLLICGLALAVSGYFTIIYAYLDFLALYILLTNRIDHVIRLDVEKILYSFSLVTAFCLIVTRFSPAAYVFEDGRSTKALVLGMTNPNLTGMMITSVIELIMVSYKRKKHKFLLGVVVAILFYLTWLTRARTSIIACVIIVVYTLFFSNRRIPNFLIRLVVMISILFVPAYLLLYRYGLSDVSFWGKMLFSGREQTYIDYISRLDNISKWIFGDLGGTIFTNAHNAALMILCSIGALGFLITYTGFVKNLTEINDRANNPTSRVAIACILSVCIQSCGESLMFSGVFPSMGFMYIFMMLASRNGRSKNQSD